MLAWGCPSQGGFTLFQPLGAGVPPCRGMGKNSPVVWEGERRKSRKGPQCRYRVEELQEDGRQREPQGFGELALGLPWGQDSSPFPGSSSQTRVPEQVGISPSAPPCLFSSLVALGSTATCVISTPQLPGADFPFAYLCFTHRVSFFFPHPLPPFQESVFTPLAIPGMD